MSSPFEIAVLDAAGNRLGDGPLIEVDTLNNTVSLDKIGTLNFSISQNALRAELIQPGVKFDIWDLVDGYLGRYSYKNDSLKPQAGKGNIVVNCEDALADLRQEFVAFRRNYYAVPVEQVIYELVNILGADGWSSLVDSGIGTTAVNYEGESILAAIDVMRDRWDKHFRIKPTKILEFGAFGQSSNVVLANLEGQEQPRFNATWNLALVDTIERKRDADEIYNKIIPLGAGQGIAQFTIQGATSGTYTVQTGINYDLSNYFYIEDSASIALYGRRTKILSLPQIRPLTNTPTDQQAAKNALKSAAEAYIARHLEPRTTYEVTVKGLRAALRVGDTVRLIYKGADRNGEILDVNADFFVMDVTRERNAKGKRSASLTISSIMQRRTTDTDVMVETINDVRALKLHVQPQAWWSENTYKQFMTGNPDYNPVWTTSAKFKIEFDDNVTDVHSVIIRFKTEPMKSPVLTHVDFATNSSYELVEDMVDDQHPSDIRIYIDGTDYTTLYGGPWAAGGANVAVDVPLNITSELAASVAGLRADHEIEFRCLTRSGEPGYPAYRPGPPLTPGDLSRGIMELNIRIQGTAMSIVALE